MNIKIINKSQHVLPHYETGASAGMDLRASIQEPVVLRPMDSRMRRLPLKTGSVLPKWSSQNMSVQNGKRFRNYLIRLEGKVVLVALG